MWNGRAPDPHVATGCGAASQAWRNNRDEHACELRAISPHARIANVERIFKHDSARTGGERLTSAIDSFAESRAREFCDHLANQLILNLQPRQLNVAC
jgi:hypothetical protein